MTKLIVAIRNFAKAPKKTTNHNFPVYGQGIQSNFLSLNPFALSPRLYHFYKILKLDVTFHNHEKQEVKLELKNTLLASFIGDENTSKWSNLNYKEYAQIDTRLADYQGPHSNSGDFEVEKWQLSFFL